MRPEHDDKVQKESRALMVWQSCPIRGSISDLLDLSGFPRALDFRDLKFGVWMRQARVRVRMLEICCEQNKQTYCAMMLIVPAKVFSAAGP